MNPIILAAWLAAVEPEPPVPHPDALYVYCLTCPAIDVTGQSERFLRESVSVIPCESSRRPAARNGRYVGLMQLDQAYAPGVDLTDPENNMYHASLLWERRGWKAWACQP